MQAKNDIVTASKEYSNKLTHSNAYPEGSSTDWWVGKGRKTAGISAALTDEIGLLLSIRTAILLVAVIMMPKSRLSL